VSQITKPGAEPSAAKKLPSDIGLGGGAFGSPLAYRNFGATFGTLKERI
jgi:hypothetical protein